MTLKGTILPGHIPVNKYTLQVIGLPPLVVTKIGGLEEELETAELPDRTQHSNGQTKPLEVTIEIMMHHPIERLALEQWLTDGKDPVAVDYKKNAVLVYLPNSVVGLPAAYGLTGCFLKSRKTADADMANDSDAQTIEYVMCIDSVDPI
jgi:hypothetical protein